MTIRRIALQATVGNLSGLVGADGLGLLVNYGLLLYAFIQNVSATDKILGRASAGAGVIEEIACTAAGRAILDDANAAAQRLTLGVVDANDRMPAVMMPTKVLNSYWHASFDEKTIVSGTCSQSADAAQTDYDPMLVGGSAGYVSNPSSANLDEIHFGSLTLNAGTYKISLGTLKASSCGIIEILHGTTSLGTWDGYVAGATYNQVVSFTYSPTTLVTGNLRIRSNGKNPSAAWYKYFVSRLEIIRTG